VVTEGPQNLSFDLNRNLIWPDERYVFTRNCATTCRPTMRPWGIFGRRRGREVAPARAVGPL